ncbi:MAG: 5'/3'-nucleotidase SurE, partial [Candidatus Limnocylindria bacterium]
RHAPRRTRRSRNGSRPETRLSTRHILITNDDGIDADALAPLAEALAPLGDVDIIVPERNWSGASHSITLFRPLRCRPTRLRSGQPAYMTDGSPTDCVRLAVLGFLKQRPDLLVSGINRGANLGDDITYSGTVAAAMEGLLSNVPSVAISIGAFGADLDFGPSASFATLLARNILERGLAADALLNVNVPALPRERIAGVEVTRLGKRNYRDQLVERLDPYGNPYYWVGGPAVAEEAEPGTDVAALREGKISVTPIYLDLTRHALIEELAKWDWGWSAPVETPA